MQVVFVSLPEQTNYNLTSEQTNYNLTENITLVISKPINMARWFYMLEYLTNQTNSNHHFYEGRLVHVYHGNCYTN